MKKILPAFLFSFFLFSTQAQTTLVYHTVVTDGQGILIPWYNPNHGSSYDHDLDLIWNFWKNIPTSGGYKYYMMDHSYSPTLQGNKVGGDQYAMALSSWALYYGYTGDTTLIDNMVYIADTYLAHRLSSPTAAWANLPYPCNYSNTTLPVFDGDFVLGAGVTQPDKAGSFGNELVTLYKITNDSSYLIAATKIANTLAANVQGGDVNNGPYPFKVNAQSGTLPFFLPGANYSANVVSTLLLFENLKNLNRGNIVQFDTATAVIKRWVKQFPLTNNNWGCFFEDIPVYSNTEINAATMAWYILNHPNDWGSTWQQDARGILDWTLSALGSHEYDSLGVTAIYEQSSDLKEGGSHTSRFASVELLYAQKTGDTSRVEQAIRQLDWATYLVDFDGKCKFSPRGSAIWYTDGYGDYVRHYLRAMAAYPEVATDSANHLLGSTSVITSIHYQPYEISYSAFDIAGTETLRLTSKPSIVKADGIVIPELTALNAVGWVWIPYSSGGVVKIQRINTRNIEILWNSSSIKSIAENETGLVLYPNPASGTITVNFTATENEAIKIQLTDVSARRLKEINVRAHASLNTQTIDVGDLPAGTYLVQLVSKNSNTTKKLVVLK